MRCLVHMLVVLGYLATISGCSDVVEIKRQRDEYMRKYELVEQELIAEREAIRAIYVED